MLRRSSSSVRIFYPEHTKEEIISKMKSYIAELRSHLPIRLVVLFGSYAEERHTAASDIDILVVYDDPKREDAHKLVIDIIDLPRLEPHIYTTKEYERMKNSTLHKEASRKGIILWDHQP